MMDSPRNHENPCYLCNSACMRTEQIRVTIAYVSQRKWEKQSIGWHFDYAKKAAGCICQQKQGKTMLFV